MIPKTVIHEETYKTAFKHYVYGLSEKWLGSGIDLSQTDSVLAKIGEVSEENHRANYLKYLLPLVDSRFSMVIPSDEVVLMHKILYNLRMNDFPYNDFMLNRICDILLKDVDTKELFATPLPEDYKDLQKIMWTFVQSFRKKVSSEFDQNDGVI